jgi:hypothetical protein
MRCFTALDSTSFRLSINKILAIFSMICLCKWRRHGKAQYTALRAFSPISRNFLTPCPIAIRCKRSSSSRKTSRRRDHVVSLLGKATPICPIVFVTAAFHPCLYSLSDTGGKLFTTKCLLVSSLWPIVRLRAISRLEYSFQYVFSSFFSFLCLESNLSKAS